jgi:deazaflavin-dependent oxidoreductase (nitroreductase family)
MRRAAVVGVPFDEGWIVVSANAGLEHRPSWAYNLDAVKRAVVYERGRRTEVAVERVCGDRAAPLWTEYLGAAPAVAHYQRMAQRDFDMFVLRPVEDE